MNHTPPRDPMQEFADRIIAELEKRVKPWVRPWDPERPHGVYSKLSHAIKTVTS
jgi:antirestriction protein ArdC